MTDQLPRVAIIYLCHNNLRHLPKVVSSWTKLDYPHDRLAILMIPNGSPDGIADAIRSEVLPRSGQDLPELILLDDGINHGFAGGNNLGIKWTLERDFDYVFLNNGDMHLHENSISELVHHAEQDQQVGSVQSLVMYWRDHQKINVSGGMFHFAGYGYARDNGQVLQDCQAHDGEEIAYASGAAVLYRTDALKKVGLLEEGFFMYHEDLELGLRLRMAGYKNIIATKSWTYHDYSFSRNPKKFAWMELYRWLVMLAYYRLATLILFSPGLLAIELFSWPLAIKGGWLRAKFWAIREWFRPATWRLLFDMRHRAQSLRMVKDKDILRFVTGRINAQETKNIIVEKIANPVISAWFWALQKLIFW